MIDKQHARRAFSRAAGSYDEAAVLQREVGQRMLERLDYMRVQPRMILDIGAGTGEASASLLKRYPKASVIALDFALPMLQRARGRGRVLRRPLPLCADLEQLPLAAHSVDMIYSNAALQWCSDLASTFTEFRRVLRPGGLLLFSSFGPDTLKELRSAWEQVDGRRHVNNFVDMHDVGDLLVEAQFAEPVMDAERITMTYQSVDQLMRDIKRIGAHNTDAGRSKKLTGKQRMQQFRDAYELFRCDGRLPSTWEVVYGHAWAPRQVTEDGVTTVSVDALRA
ncbi:MAG: malonyl-ACP O-methyltransferase BioC [Pseudomonadota bacterium]